MRNYVEIFAKNVQRILHEQERKPAWLAKKSGLKSSVISRLLNNEGNPTMETLVAVAEALDENLDSLLRPEEAVSAEASVSTLEQDLVTIQGKLAKIEVLFNETVDPDEISKLLKSREILRSEADVIQAWIANRKDAKDPLKKLRNSIITTLKSASLDHDELEVILASIRALPSQLATAKRTTSKAE